jgi:hypothetical protein
MATAAAPRTATPFPAHAWDRAFYSGLAIVMALTVFAGFAPSYYLRGVLGGASPTSGGELSTMAHIHGVVFSVWVVLFLVQTALVAGHRVKVHQKLGLALAGWAAVMLVVGVVTAIKAAARGSAPPEMDALVFLAIPLFDMVLFAIFVGAALWYRRQKETHKRLMLMAYFSIIVAAVARLPGVLEFGPPGFFGATFAFFLAGMAYDLATRRRVHKAYLWGAALFAVSVPARLLLAQTEAWRAFAEMVTR